MPPRPSAGGAPSLLNPFICARCLRHQRQTALPRLAPSSPSSLSHSRRRYATASAPASSEPSPPPNSGITALPHRKLIALSGPDAPKFLQGLTTNNVPSPAQNPARKGWYTAFLNAQGRVLYDAFVYPCRDADAAATGGGGGGDDWACLIEVDGDCVDGLTRLLKRHKLRSKVQIRPAEEWGVWSAWSDGDGDDAAIVSASSSRSGNETAPVPIHLADHRVPSFGHRILLPLSAAYLSSSGSSGPSPPPPPDLPHPFQALQPTTPTAYAARRYLAGLPEGPAELRPGEALPLESNVDLMRGVDFRKGCYVGQELTIRTKHTGVVRKRILPVRLYDLGGEEPRELAFEEGGGAAAEAPPAAGADIKRVAGEGEGEGADGGGRRAGRSAGKWLAGVGNVGLALCRLEMMTDVKVAAEGMGNGGGGYTPGMRFGLKWTVDGESGERAVGVKAFVPEWHRIRAAEEARGKKKPVQED